MIKGILKSYSLVLGLVIIVLVIMMAIFAPYIAPRSPTDMDVPQRLSTPSGEHWFGTDSYGRDVFSRIIYGSRISLQVGFIVLLVNGFFGGFIGVIAGFFTRTENILMRIMDAMMAFPSIVLALALVSILGASKINAAIAVGIVAIPRTARIVRSTIITERENEYVEASIALGNNRLKTLFFHVLPNSLAPFIIQQTLMFSFAVLAEAGLSFLGLGTPPPAPSWGNMLAEARPLMNVAPWLLMFPGIAIVLTVMAINLTGDGLRDIMDPRIKDYEKT